jgi:hypothetical protein
MVELSDACDILSPFAAGIGSPSVRMDAVDAWASCDAKVGWHVLPQQGVRCLQRLYQPLGNTPQDRALCTSSASLCTSLLCFTCVL